MNNKSGGHFLGHRTENATRDGELPKAAAAVFAKY